MPMDKGSYGKIGKKSMKSGKKKNKKMSKYNSGLPESMTLRKGKGMNKSMKRSY